MKSPRPARTAIAGLWLALWLACALSAGQPTALNAAAAQATPTPALPPAAPEPVLKLISFSSAEYPTLKFVVTVRDKATGQPQTGLTPADFSATVGLTPTLVSQVSPAAVLTQAMRVVLVIDNSLTDDASLDKIKTAASRFLDSLGPADEAALLTAADTVRVAAPLTKDHEQVKAALAGLPRVVTKTSLHQGLADAASALNAPPAADAVRVIVAITNSGDNARPTLPPEQVISQAAAASAPIYAINFTSTDSGNSLDNIARQTRGRYYALTSADQIDAALQTILPPWRQGYEISVEAPVMGDGKDYTARLSLGSAAGAAPVEGRFTAPLIQMAINGPGVADGQTVIGAVQLATTAVAPAPPILAVEYQLDGHTFATLTEPPYTFQWDSTSVNPGRHQLKVTVRDSGGNRGEVEVSILVALPFAVTASSDREQVPVGDKVVIRAQVNSPARIDRVEFLQGDDTLLFSDSTAPYNCTIDTKGEAPGVRYFKVRAVDYLGRSAETAVFQIELRPTFASTVPAFRRWGLISLNILAILAALLVAIFGSLALGARLRRRLQSIFTLDIWNESNLRNRYSLRAEAALQALSLEFRLQGAALPLQALLAGGPSAAPAGEPVAEAGGGPAPAEGGTLDTVKETGAYKSYRKATGIAGAAADFLNTIAGLLPGGAGVSLRNAATSLRQGESMEYEVEEAGDRARSVQHAASDAAASLGKSPAQPATRTPTASPSPSTRAAPAASVPQERPGLSETWALTPYVEPGEKLSLQLYARPLKSTRTQTYGVRILSRLVEAPEATPVSEASQITVAGLTFFQRLQPFLLAAVLLAAAAGLTVLLIYLWGG